MNRRRIHEPRHIGDKIADRTASGIGNWNFIIAQATIMAIWFVLNTAGWFVWKWDMYPFILLNLAMSAEAAFSTPVIMMSQNRQAQKDRARDDIEAQEVEQDHKLLLEIHAKVCGGGK